ncbi:HNH endonuclease [Patescibacteria group bacterium]|nr:HNH endonuclease [Patescibacteria group bacterium]MBU1246545.1 HNH endonuclease [Patescibacteria group bacterium]MBU1519113.1 HNH endonuclease [Patescibacteria group bacterium]MBU1730132.1 HNH endonuclease [Patescibacteria group bacterium]MBU1956157.1 HNH endonuclease [Patescibacteria group bacterium]
MKIELNKIPIREVIAGYKNSAEEGVTAYNGKLNIRPKYQREFVYKEKQQNAIKLEAEIKELMMDEDVTKKFGIYPFVLTRQEKFLNIRAFTDKMKREAYERQKGICKKCKKYFEIEEMEADHIKPWHEGGKTVSGNCQMLCKDCNRRKSGK